MKKLIAAVLILICAFTAVSCSRQDTNGNPAAIPEDFSFALTWGCYGISSYDSQTGVLIKTTDATHPDDYITSYQLTAEDKEYIYGLISSLDINSYPDTYDPNVGMMSSPPMTLVLTVRLNGEVKTVKAEDIAYSYESKNEKGQEFLSACYGISRILISTEEWQALPEYEYLYD